MFNRKSFEAGRETEMKIEILRYKEETNWNPEYALSVFVDNELKLGFADGCPEDGTIHRNFEDILKIPQVLKVMKEAMDRNEEIEIIEKDCKTVAAVFKDEEEDES